MTCLFYPREKARAALRNNLVLRKALARARRKGVFEVMVSGAEKYNRFDHDLQDEPDGPGPNGHYDVEGHSCVDVYGYVTMNPLNPKDLYRLVGEFVTWFRDAWRYKFFSGAPIYLTWECWVWTVESLDVEHDNMAHDSIDGKHKSVSDTMKAYDAARASISLDDVRRFMDASPMYLPVHDGMWVNKMDPTVVVIDQGKFPFDMKDGWSNAAVLRLLSLWSTQMQLGIINFAERSLESYLEREPLSKKLKRLLMFHRKKEDRDAGQG